MSKSNKRFLYDDEDRTTIGDILKYGLITIVILFVLGGIVRMCSVADGAVAVVQNTIDPRVMLKKYENFKNLASAIDKQRAEIMAYQEQLKDKTIDKDEKTQLRAEMRGVVANHNGLVAQYNADMAKANYAFCNAGSMPQSNMTPLPREYQDYVTSYK